MLVADADSQLNINPLDRAPWSSLTGDHQHLATFDASRRAAKYRKDVGLFGALDIPDAAGWDAAAAITRPGGIFGVFQADVELPTEGWEVLFHEQTDQLVAGKMRQSEAPAKIVPLGSSHVGAMVELTALAQPGPFKAGTIEMGGYFGIFHGNQLVAMAGQRFCPTGYTEVSAVCTHPNAQKQGYGGALTHHVVNHTRAAEREAMLHTRHNNTNARHLYETMGFEFRRQVDVVVARRLI
ncbi:MAG: ribosomal protein S18 acetylase RimI-like enzyme [Acidimicrobiales bacterium]